MTGTRAPLAERLWRHVVEDPETGCWLHDSNRRYPTIGVGARRDGTTTAHRAAWEITNGPVPPGLYVCHRCDTPACCNPQHLFLGTPADNVADAVAKGRHAYGERHGRARLTETDVRDIRYECRAGVGSTELAQRYGVSRAAIYFVQQRLTWAHVEDGPIWRSAPPPIRRRRRRVAR